jgi:hypothetical protein
MHTMTNGSDENQTSLENLKFEINLSELHHKYYLFNCNFKTNLP